MLYWRVISQTILFFEEEKEKHFLRGGDEQQGAGPLSTSAPAGVSGRVRHADSRIDLIEGHKQIILENAVVKEILVFEAFASDSH